MQKYEYMVSIVIPIYNSENYLEECIESILNQKYDLDKIQIILVNDGSTDNSLKICKKYAKKYDNILIIDQKNSGVSSARNNGIKKSKGKYITLLDSDDLISRNTIHNLINFFEKNYDSVDIITYPIYFYKNNHLYKNGRYNNYDKGTKIYDVNKYIYLNQSNINIMFKNNLNNNILFNEKMHLAEDQDFCTRLIMNKEKIGFVKNAKYLYRKHGGGASDLTNKPYYCFDYIMEYNESLLEKYPTSKYVQSLVINTLNWRLNSDMLFPYHLKDKDYKKALERIKKLISKLDIENILYFKNINDNNKLFLLKFSDRKFTLKQEKNNCLIYYNNKSVYNLLNYKAEILRTKVINNKLNIYGTFANFSNAKNIKLIIRKKYKNKVIDDIVETFPTNLLLYDIGEDNKYINIFDVIVDLEKVDEFSFYLVINNDEIKLDFRFEKFSSFDFVKDNYRILFDFKNKSFKIKKANFLSKLSSRFKNDYKCLISKPRALAYRIVSIFLYNYKNIWIYMDNCKSFDNGYYQFKHDINKHDNIRRYYIYSNKSELNKRFNENERKYLVKYGSIKHKMLYINSKKIITSFVDISLYCPFNNSLMFYKDLASYELIYLQHGILHASLRKMYSKRNKEIDKFVISTNFEKNNLINHYGYSEKDLLITGMPRNNFEINSKVKKDTILFAPSWRSYLIGNFVNIKRELKTQEFLNSKYFKEIYDFLHSKELKKYIEDNNLNFIFKLHPIFSEYLKHFKLEKLKYIKTTNENVDINQYILFITDFSSFQFDFVKAKIPIIYFLPDEYEISCGLHTYRTLDLKYEDAFGTLCKTKKELFTEMNKIKDNNFKVANKYEKRMETFFYDIKNSQEKIYQYLIKE